MKMILFLLLAACFASAACNMENRAATAQNQTAVNQKTLAAANKTPVLVELFTSEGCSSCPPADRALAFLEKEQPISPAEIITLAMHVDYWNRLGWTDEFSSPLFSQRQELYAQRFKQADVYTPQMVVDGSEQFTGSDSAKATKSILDAAKSPKAGVELSVDGDKLKVKIPNMPEHENASVFLAIAEDNLISSVKRGENSGKTLEHVSVVRELKSIGNVAPQDKSFETEAVFQLQPNWKKENLKLVVFVQGNQNRKIYGVNRISTTKSENPA
jgi:hypothetical protein